MDQETWAMLPAQGLDKQVEFIIKYVKDQWAVAYTECQEKHIGLVEFLSEEVE